MSRFVQLLDSEVVSDGQLRVPRPIPLIVLLFRVKAAVVDPSAWKSP